MCGGVAALVSGAPAPPRGDAMASVSAANLSTKAKIDVVGSLNIPAFSEEVISNKNPRNWNDIPEHILLKIFDCLTRDDCKGRDWVSALDLKVASSLL